MFLLINDVGKLPYELTASERGCHWLPKRAPTDVALAQVFIVSSLTNK